MFMNSVQKFEIIYSHKNGYLSSNLHLSLSFKLREKSSAGTRNPYDDSILRSQGALHINHSKNDFRYVNDLCCTCCLLFYSKVSLD